LISDRDNRPELPEKRIDGLAIVIPLRPIVKQLRDQLLTVNESPEQQTFRDRSKAWPMSL
jgi:hypothetical protein